MSQPPSPVWREGGAGPELVERTQGVLRDFKEVEGRKGRAEVGIWTIPKAWQGNGVTSGDKGIHGLSELRSWWGAERKWTL